LHTVDWWAETNSSSCGVKRATNIGLGFDQSDLSPDESTTNIGLFKVGTGSLLEHVDQPLLTLVGPDESFTAQPAPARGASSGREPGKLRLCHPGPEARGHRWLNLASVAQVISRHRAQPSVRNDQRHE